MVTIPASANAPAMIRTIATASPSPEGGADHGGQEVVGRTLEEEHLDQVTALHADCASRAHLTAALGGQHHEHQEDQQNPSGDCERAER